MKSENNGKILSGTAEEMKQELYRQIKKKTMNIKMDIGNGNIIVIVIMCMCLLQQIFLCLMLQNTVVK